MTPEIRIQPCNARPINPTGDYILYWMIANRRIVWNFSLERAVEWANQLHKPLVILEALRCDYRWASDRLHRFVLDGMLENARRTETANAFYYPYVEPVAGDGKGLLAKLSQRAAVVVTDDFPCFFLPRMVESAARQVPVKMEKIDSNGLLPLRATNDVFSSAYAFRRFLQKNLPLHLSDFPKPEPLKDLSGAKLATPPEEIIKSWPPASYKLLSGSPEALSKLPIDHSVNMVEISGGSAAAEERCQAFLQQKLSQYARDRNEPELDATSGLSPYLHFGHISSHQIFHQLKEQEDWYLTKLSGQANGRREGWWGMSPTAEAFLDQIITWRELGYNLCWQRREYDQYDSLPDWAKQTLAEHANDPREVVYSLEEFEQARTHDQLWNAAQIQLVSEGRIHNYLRMLWGKKILEWSRTPQEALEIMIELNNKYALDGRNPNSYAGIFWVLGRYDRPWGPQRAIFGKIRYMSSENTARKMNVKNYIQKYNA